jgi:uncharacterized protein (DUF433 family)
MAMRLFPITRDEATDPRAILIDPTRRFGRPVLASTNLETASVAGRFFARDPIVARAADFAISEGEAEEAIRFESQLCAA